MPLAKPSIMAKRDTTTADAWAKLRNLTAARIALGRAGMSLPTAPHLEFQLAHARARDAVHAGLDTEALGEKLRGAGLEPLLLSSAAPDRTTYLQRPDLGRMLSPASQRLLDRRAKSGRKAVAGTRPTPQRRWDVVFAIADGRSALAVERDALGLLNGLLPMLDRSEWTLAPVAVVAQGRVAIGDEIGERLGAGLVVVLIGERPGLSAPDSLGVYLTWAPKVCRLDAERNCISNIREGGQSYAAAAATLFYLMTEARRRKVSGVALKDETIAPALPSAIGPNFLGHQRAAHDK